MHEYQDGYYRKQCADVCGRTIQTTIFGEPIISRRERRLLHAIDYDDGET